jgi:hypothetical protein
VCDADDVRPGRATVVLGALLIVASAFAVARPGSRTLAATCTPEVGPGIPPPASLPAGIPGFHAAWYGQSGYQTLCPGQMSTAVVAYYNSGSFGWVRDVMGQVAYLGTWNPEPGQDLPSVVGGDGSLGSPATGWPRYNRVAIQPADYVGPGQVAWFQFTLQAPQTPGTYRLAIRPLVEGATWMEDYGVFWVLTVKTADNALPPPPGGPPPPVTTPPAATTPPATTTAPPVGGGGFVGSAVIASTPDGSQLGVAEANRSVATAGGAVTSLSIYLDASNRATQLELGLYADGSGAPGALLAKGALSSVTNGAWNTVAIPSNALTNGTAYWVARLSTAGGDLVTRVNPAVANPDRTDTRNLTTLPASFTPGGSYPHLTSMYAGNAPASTPGPTPTPTPTATPTPTPTATPTPPPGSFTCTQVIGYSQTSNWYDGFETAVTNSRYQLFWYGGGAVRLWADPSYQGWVNGALYSPCASGSGAPDRVILDVTEDFFVDPSTVGQVASDINAAIANIRTKLPSVRQIYVQPVVGGPGGTTQCFIRGTVIRASANHPYIVQAIARVVGGTVLTGPSPTVRTCADYLDDGQYVGHLTPEASGPIGQSIGSFYAPLP